MNRDVQCEVAASHGAACVDLGPVFNGPDLAVPNHLNAQDEMHVVADAILASGLDELE